MSKSDATLGDFHEAKKKELHPPDSIGNMQVWNESRQKGAIEFQVNAEKETVDVNFIPSGKGRGSIPL